MDMVLGLVFTNVNKEKRHLKVPFSDLITTLILIICIGLPSKDNSNMVSEK